MDVTSESLSRSTLPYMHDKIRKYAFMLREDGEREEMMRVKLCDHEESSNGGRVLCDAADAAEEAFAERGG